MVDTQFSASIGRERKPLIKVESHYTDWSCVMFKYVGNFIWGSEFSQMGKSGGTNEHEYFPSGGSHTHFSQKELFLKHAHSPYLTGSEDPHRLYVQNFTKVDKIIN